MKTQVRFNAIAKMAIAATAALASFVVLSPVAAFAATPTCQDYENYTGSDFFTETNERTVTPMYREKLIRKAGAAFWSVDTTNMTMDEIENQAEDPYADAVKDPNGNIFALANLGFGGGNSISYLYKWDTLEFLPIAIYDGDCIEVGNTDSLPIEVDPVFDGEATLTCTIQDAAAPVSEFTVTVPTEANLYTGSTVSMTAKLNPAFENLTALAGSDTLTRTMMPSQVTLTTSRQGAGANLSFNFDNEVDGERVISLLLTARAANGSKVSGRVYTNKTGGYWASDAYEYSYSASCSGTGVIEGRIYKRTLKY